MKKINRAQLFEDLTSPLEEFRKCNDMEAKISKDLGFNNNE